MIRLLQAVRIVCIVFALLVIASSLIWTAMNQPVPFTLMQRLALALPLLAIFNVATTYLKKHPSAGLEPKDLA